MVGEVFKRLVLFSLYQPLLENHLDHKPNYPRRQLCSAASIVLGVAIQKISLFGGNVWEEAGLEMPLQQAPGDGCL